ncbi:MAG: hypothetical protein ABFD91_04235 [Anaerohalosphaeraceae bacterium]
MSENKYNEEVFDLWLSANLKVSPCSNPAFTHKVVQEMERLKAQKMLRHVILQERLIGGLLVLTVLTGIGLLCCPLVLRGIYTLFETAMIAFIRCLMNPSFFIVAIVTLVLLLILQAMASLWINVYSES